MKEKGALRQAHLHRFERGGLPLYTHAPYISASMDYVHQIVAYITAHPEMALLIIAGTAFGESFAFLSLFFPGTAILIAAGTLASTNAINPVSAALAGIIGGVLGDAISFWLGTRFGPALPGIWPFRHHRAALDQAIAFFQRFGWASVFIGRFFGPLRAIIPLAAGMLKMPPGAFYIANILSAVIWAPALLYSGYLIGAAAARGWNIEVLFTLLAVIAAGAIALGIALRRRLGIR